MKPQQTYETVTAALGAVALLGIIVFLIRSPIFHHLGEGVRTLAIAVGSSVGSAIVLVLVALVVVMLLFAVPRVLAFLLNLLKG